MADGSSGSENYSSWGETKTKTKLKTLAYAYAQVKPRRLVGCALCMGPTAHGFSTMIDIETRGNVNLNVFLTIVAFIFGQ